MTGDQSILEENVPFLKAEPLKPDEQERYGQFPAGETKTLYEHCCRALTKGITSGPHELPLIGANDWNDGMNRVGIHGRGESIWLGWFLSATLSDFADICDLMEDHKRANELRAKRVDLHRALEKSGWDGPQGGWYLRAYYDDGSRLGSSANNECQIDSIAQSWAVISGAADGARAAQAMEAGERELIRPENRLALLFTPPFDRTPLDPGYIKGYPPGIRENGGQYTHAAVWSIIAFAALGDGDRAARLFSLLNPINHARTPADVFRYKVEPYVMAADVYASPAHIGRGGWTWYTGSAGWMQRAGIESILGLRVERMWLHLDPRIPNAWTGFEVTLRHGSARYEILVENPDGVGRGIVSAQLDMQAILTRPLCLPLVDDGLTHRLHVRLGHSGAKSRQLPAPGIPHQSTR
jgi:cyclic beta-1,2-glucan synthetase